MQKLHQAIGRRFEPVPLSASQNVLSGNGVKTRLITSMQQPETVLTLLCLRPHGHDQVKVFSSFNCQAAQNHANTLDIIKPSRPPSPPLLLSLTSGPHALLPSQLVHQASSLPESPIPSSKPSPFTHHGLCFHGCDALCSDRRCASDRQSQTRR